MPSLLARIPDVTVVIPAYNPGAHLLESVESALAQSVSVEVIVVDDGSREGTMPPLPDDPRVRTVRQPNLGVAAARNRGTREASAPLIAFLDADDRWSPRKLERQTAAFAAAPEATLCYTGFTFINHAGLPSGLGWATDRADYLALLEACPIAMSSVVVRRQALVDTGGFDTFYSIVADWELWLRLAEAHGPFLFIPECLVEYRMAPHGIGQMSGDPWMSYRETMSVYDRHSLRAARAGDSRRLASIARGQRITRQTRASQAAARFVDSCTRANRPDWRMLYVAGRIDLAAAARAAIRRSVGQAWRKIGRRRTG